MILAPALLAFLSPAPLAPLAPATQEGWRQPPREVVDLVDAPLSPFLVTSPDARWMLFVERDALPSLAVVARTWEPLAGIRVDTAANARHRTSYYAGLTLRELEGGEEIRIPLPEGRELAGASWSHDSRSIAITLVGAGGTELWLARTDAVEPVLVTDRLNAVFGSGWTWMPDGSSLACLLVPRSRGAAPERPAVAAGPNIQETTGEASPLRTYQDLLDDAHDEALFDHYGTSQMAFWVDGTLKNVGRPGIITDVEPSPDGEHLLVSELRRPYSYLMPYYLFPQRTEVRDLEGRTEHVVADLPLGENIPIGGVRTGPRSVQWKAGEDATLVWVEALDGGDPKREVEHRDRWLSLAAPFGATPGELVRVEHRARGITWLEDPNSAIVTDYDRDRRWTRSLLVDLTDATAEPKVLEDRSIRDRYGDPGSLVFRTDSNGSRIVRQDGDWVYRTGRGASSDGDRPFLHRQSLEDPTEKPDELWECSPGSYESVVAIVQSGTARKPSFITSYESPNEAPNWRLRDQEHPGVVKALTTYPDPQPALRGIHKELVTYERSDGVPLSATLYLPKGYDPDSGERLPLFVWAYPREFNDPKTAGQVSGSPYRFTRFGGTSHLFLLTQGYAVLDNAAMPVIGDAETMNDTFIEQIVDAADAGIAYCVERGIADPDRVSVGGHSYGAFMTANLLAHCDLFRAGIARSGAYNRSLTPFGFQSERRTVWEATDTYVAVSPFFHADGITEPLLLIHGEVDNNSGTFPMQSDRLFQAIKGLGGTSRLVFLPHESHGYRARESVLHTLAEMIDWLDRHTGPRGEG